MSTFRFKQFEIQQDLSPMKVGTDGVLLGAWVRLEGTETQILDIGTGTGVIALMLAQRTSCDDLSQSCRVVGIDISSVEEARQNAMHSPWKERVEMVQCPIQDYSPNYGFDLIVSNPPYFEDALTCPDLGRTTARHTLSLSFRELSSAVARLLNPQGRFGVVLPKDAEERFLHEAGCDLKLVRCTEVKTTPRRPVKRVLMEFVRQNHVSKIQTVERDVLTIGTGQHEEFTEDYRTLTHDFYLKF